MLRDIAGFLLVACAVLLVLGTINEILGLGIWEEGRYPTVGSFGGFVDFLGQYVAACGVLGIAFVFLLSAVSARGESD